MVQKEIETTLVKKVAKFPKICTNCNKDIHVGIIYHQEQGEKEHLHSLIARQFCSDCYAKYGARKLLSGKTY